MSKKKALSTGDKTVLALSARGDCYNPTCNCRLVTSREGRPIVQFEIAHIRDEQPPANEEGDIGWRYWPAEDLNQTERNHFSNLILLCKPCHALIDKIDPRSYSVELLHQWKIENEGLRGEALEESLGVIGQASLNELIVEAISSLNSMSDQSEQRHKSQMWVESILAEIVRYRRLVDQLRIGEKWVRIGENGQTVSLSDMGHNVTFEIIADTSLPSYVRQSAIEAKNAARKGAHPSVPRKFADYLQRDLKWEANRLRRCIADGINPFEEAEPSFDDRNEQYDRALKSLDE